MNPRTTAILFAVALGLGAFVYFYEIEGEQGRRDAEMREKRLFPGVEADAVEWISLRTSDGRDARVERRDGAWWLVEPLEFPGDAFALDAIASTLEEITSETVYESPQEASVYGLDDPPAHEVHFAAGGEEFTLRTGDKAPMGGDTYASLAGAAPVYTVQTFRVNSLDKTLDDLRDKRILDFDASSVQRVTASWPDGRMVLARRDGAWQLEAPVSGEADAETVQDLLSGLSFLRAASFADEPLPDDVTGLDAPAFAVEIEIGTPDAEGGEEGVAAEPRKFSLAVGSVDDDGQRTVRAERPTLYRIASARLEDFPRELFAYRFKDLSSFGVLEARQLDLVFRPAGGDPVTVSATFSDGRWSAEPEDVDPDRLERLVRELSSLEASRVMAESMGPDELAALGLDPPRVTLVVRGTGEEPLAELRLGETDGTEGIVAQMAGRPTVFQIDYELAEHIPVSLDALHNRFLTAEPPEAPPVP